MLTIRLRRVGAKRDPHYRVVVTESSARRDGPFIEIVGHYHPRRQPAEIVLDMERVEAYLGQGAQMSDTVRSLCRRIRSGRVEAPAETAPATDTSDEAQLEAAAEGPSAETEEDSPAEEAEAETDETGKQD